MKFLIVGRWRSIIHEQPIYDQLKKLNYDVKKFKWNQYYENKNQILNIILKILNKLFKNIIEYFINMLLIKSIHQNKPDIVFIYRGNIINFKTLNKIKKNNKLTLISYNNDNPFSILYTKNYWEKYNQSIKYYDLIFSYRKSNIDNYYNYGAKEVIYLPPWYIKDVNKKVNLSKKDYELYKSDAVFVGHYENDGRIELISKLIESGINIKIFGPGWNKHIKKNNNLKHLYPIKYLYGNDYNKAFCGSKICLVFYSTLNYDNYTRKCFEIPATGSFMLAKYNKEITNFFEEGKEIKCFKNTKELIQLIKYYLKNSDERNKISTNGYKRLIASNYDSIHSVNQILLAIKNLKK